MRKATGCEAGQVVAARLSAENGTNFVAGRKELILSGIIDRFGYALIEEPFRDVTLLLKDADERGQWSSAQVERKIPTKTSVSKNESTNRHLLKAE